MGICPSVEPIKSVRLKNCHKRACSAEEPPLIAAALRHSSIKPGGTVLADRDMSHLTQHFPTPLPCPKLVNQVHLPCQAETNSNYPLPHHITPKVDHFCDLN
jgi:hypothetical protein